MVNAAAVVSKVVCVCGCLAVIIIEWLVILGCFFGFLLIVRLKGVSFFYCRLYFLVRFF